MSIFRKRSAIPWRYDVLDAPPGNRLAINMEVAKKFLRIDGHDEDEMIKILIQSATSMFEKVTGLTLLNTQYRTTRDTLFNRMELRKAPFVSFDNIEREVNDVWEVLDTDDFKVHVKQPYVDLHCVNNAPFGVNASDCISTVRVDFTAGYGEKAKDVPANIQHILMQLLTFFYEARGDCGEEDIPPTIMKQMKACKIRNLHVDLR